MKPVYDAVTAMGAGTTGRGRLSDLIADTGASAIALSQQLAPLFTPDLPDGSLVPTLTLAARLINADLGVRVIACSFGSFDLHDGHSWGYPQLIAQLDAGIDAFFTTLSSTFRRPGGARHLLRVRPDRPGQRLRRHRPRHRLGAARHRRQRAGRPLRRPARASTIWTAAAT